MVSRLTLVERGAQPPKPPRPPRLIRATTHYTNLADKLAKELGPNWTLKSTVDIPSSYQKKRFRFVRTIADGTVRLLLAFNDDPYGGSNAHDGINCKVDPTQPSRIDVGFELIEADSFGGNDEYLEQARQHPCIILLTKGRTWESMAASVRRRLLEPFAAQFEALCADARAKRERRISEAEAREKAWLAQQRAEQHELRRLGPVGVQLRDRIRELERQLDDERYDKNSVIVQLAGRAIGRPNLSSELFRPNNDDEQRKWRQIFTEAVIDGVSNAAETNDGRRAPCPLCGDVAQLVYGDQGFKLPEGLRRHLDGWGDPHRKCPVMRAIDQLLRGIRQTREARENSV